jgi:SH3 domain-containing YSC84-like protein 1
MKTILLGILITGLASSAFALDKTQLDDRIRSLTAQFSAMQQDTKTAVPVNDLARAQGIILLDRTGGAFIFGYHTGNGVALARDQKGQWSPAGFVSSSGASLGAQVGGTKDFFVVLLMSPAVAQALKESSMDFGAQAYATGGTQSGGAQATVNSGPEVLVYSQRNGLYAGASIKGGSVSEDKDANDTYYGGPVSMNDILFEHQVTPTSASADLIAKIEQFSR